MKAYCNQEKIQELLNRRPLVFLVEEMNKMGIKIGYRNFHSLYSNKSNWMATYALACAEILNCKVEDIFYLESE